MPQHDDKLLKSDLFGEIRCRETAAGRCILRDVGQASPWVRWLARRLMRREARGLLAAEGMTAVPDLLRLDDNSLQRAYLGGQPMQIARPDERRYFREALRVLRHLHRRGIVHNDLAKEPNWLVLDDGTPGLIDFQLAMQFRSRGRLFRTLAREDLRHLLKHKRTYCPQDLTAGNRRILATPSWPARVWSRTGKPLYLLITRRLLGWADREGAHERQRRDRA
jgi:RIO-like serine/threonine protein kinase